ncbi:TonB-dependent receptor [Aurantiacibacter suaedae]|uniref:TonB-dependent receptor n=1 Tax=Aurantiacibacter suaedae TaxID=2545755 RepID=UPI001F502C4A|nr:TonB-dependent receptor [Aurantiacibacter suaedae]
MSVFALALGGLASPATAQINRSQPDSLPETSEASESDTSGTIIVTGIRAALSEAIETRRESPQVVDSIVAEDIGKLPDNNVVEALQRLTGVQVTNREGGETNTLSIRGLPDALTTFNGRKIFTASGTAFALADIPANLVSRIDVYKTRSATQIETGLAGQVNVVTRRPLDFDGFAISVNARGVYNEAADSFNPNGSLLVSNRWETGAGDIGVLVAASYAKTEYRDMSLFSGALVPFATENPPPGFAPLERIFPETGAWTPGLETGLPTDAGATFTLNGVETPYYLSRDANFAPDVYGERERPAINAALQWAPNSSSTYTVEFLYNGFRSTTFNNLHFTFVDFWGALGSDPGSTFNVYDGTNIISDRVAGDVFGFQSGDFTDNKTDSYVGAFNADWAIGDNLNITTDLSYQWSKFETQFLASRLTRVASQIAVDFNADDGVPSWNFSDNALLYDPSVWTVGELYDNASTSQGDAITWQTDGVYEFDGSFLKAFRAGFRYDERGAADTIREQDAPALGQPLTNLPSESYFISDDFFNGRADVPMSWINISGEYLQANADEIRRLYRDSVDPGILLSDELSQIKTFDISERTLSAYGEVDLEQYVGDVRLFLQAGLRYVNVNTDLTFTDRLTGTTLDDGAKASEFLPSLTAVADLTDNFRVKFNYGRTLRRPAFADLNPYFALTGDLTDVGRGSGTGGNPELEPTRSTNYDLSLEWYFQPGSAIFLTAFKRDVKGLVVPLTTLLTIPGTGLNTDRFAVTRPENASQGELKGLELGFVYFPDLPGILNGLGATGSLTVLDSSQNIPISNEAGQIVDETESDFFGVSDLSYNITAAYDRGALGLRLSYVWRENFLNNNESRLFANPIGIWRRPERSLDFQLNYNINERIGVSFDAVNLTKELQQSYYRFGDFGGPDQFNLGNTLLARTFAIGVRYNFN